MDMAPRSAGAATGRESRAPLAAGMKPWGTA